MTTKTASETRWRDFRQMAYLTTAHRIDLSPVLESGFALDMALYLISRLIDERDENMVHGPLASGTSNTVRRDGRSLDTGAQRGWSDFRVSRPLSQKQRRLDREERQQMTVGNLTSNVGWGGLLDRCRGTFRKWDISEYMLPNYRRSVDGGAVTIEFIHRGEWRKATWHQVGQGRTTQPPRVGPGFRGGPEGRPAGHRRRLRRGSQRVRTAPRSQLCPPDSRCGGFGDRRRNSSGLPGSVT